MNKRNIMKELCIILAVTIVVAIIIFLSALVIIKHNEIFKFIFSPISGRIAIYIIVACIIFLAGYALCFFTKYEPARSKASIERQKLKNELKNSNDRLEIANNWIAYQQTLLEEKNKQEEEVQPSQQTRVTGIKTVLADLGNIGDNSDNPVEEENESILQTSDEE